MRKKTKKNSKTQWQGEEKEEYKGENDEGREGEKLRREEKEDEWKSKWRTEETRKKNTQKYQMRKSYKRKYSNNKACEIDEKKTENHIKRMKENLKTKTLKKSNEKNCILQKRT